LDQVLFPETHGGGTLNQLCWPARHEVTILVTAIYRLHPDKVNVWWGDPTADHGLATLEGGDVMPIDKGTVLIGLCPADGFRTDFGE
jgi:arginine deiminase